MWWDGELGELHLDVAKRVAEKDGVWKMPKRFRMAG